MKENASIDGYDAEDSAWLTFFSEVSHISCYAEVMGLLRKQPARGAPGREYFANLGLFIQCYEISPTARPAEIAQYLRIFRLIAPSRDLPILAVQLIQEDLMKAINERHALHSHSLQPYLVERKRAEADLAALNASLERRVEERTAALVAVNQELEQFCRSVSHDLRGPLRTIIATSLMLKEDHASQLDEAAIGLLNRQEASGRRLVLLIDELLRLSRLTHQEMVWLDVDLSGLAMEIADELSSRTWPHPPHFTIEPGIHARGDRSLLRVVLQNLLENACKFSPNGARVTFAMLDEPTRTVYCVSDEGVGFDMQYVDKLFQPFERLVLDSEFEGTGIGLATVDRVIRRHGGEVWADSELGKGTRISFTVGL